MRTRDVIFWGISGTLIAGLIAFIASLLIDVQLFSLLVCLMFLVAPALSCVAGGLRDYRITTMVGVYTLIGVLAFSMARPVAAIAPDRRSRHHAQRVLNGDIGAGNELFGGCVFAMGRILFIRKKKSFNTDSADTK